MLRHFAAPQVVAHLSRRTWPLPQTVDVLCLRILESLIKIKTKSRNLLHCGSSSAINVARISFDGRGYATLVAGALLQLDWSADLCGNK